jgi:hypothetical protein
VPETVNVRVRKSILQAKRKSIRQLARMENRTAAGRSANELDTISAGTLLVNVIFGLIRSERNAPRLPHVEANQKTLT